MFLSFEWHDAQQEGSQVGDLSSFCCGICNLLTKKGLDIVSRTLDGGSSQYPLNMWCAASGTMFVSESSGRLSLHRLELTSEVQAPISLFPLPPLLLCYYVCSCLCLCLQP